MNWQELASLQFAEIDRATPVVLPVAAVEQYGAHLKIGAPGFEPTHLNALVYVQRSVSGVT